MQRREWKKIKRARKVWVAIAEQCDLDPEEWVILWDILNDNGLEFAKSKRKGKATSPFIRLVQD